MGSKASKKVEPGANGRGGVEGERNTVENDQADGLALPNIINVAAENQNDESNDPSSQTQHTGRRNMVTTSALGAHVTPSNEAPTNNSNEGEETDGIVPAVWSADGITAASGEDGIPAVPGEQYHVLVGKFNTLTEAYDNLMQVNEQMGGIQDATEAELVRKDNEIRELKLKLNKMTEQIDKGTPNAIDAGNDKEQLQLLNAQIESLREARSDLRTRCEELKIQKHRLQEQLEAKSAECEDFKTRLSRIASDKLKDENPNIADLGDKNRPDKLAERFGELYCNEWTDVLEEFTSADHNMSEKEVIHLLLEFVKEIFYLCHASATKQLTDLRQQILLFTGHAISGKSLKNRPELSTKPFKEERKAQYILFMDSLLNDVRKIKSDLLPGKDMSTKKLRRYLKETTEICWLMCIQDPPIVLYFQGRKGGRFDQTYYTAYTDIGQKIAFVVWPAILLYKDGPIMHKGVAQGKSDTNKSSSFTDDHSPETSTVKSHFLSKSKRSHKDID